MALRRMLSNTPIPKKERRAETTSRPSDLTKPTLDSFSEGREMEDENRREIIVDQREMTSSVAEELIRSGFRVIAAPLGEGDYQISDRVGIERKTAQDLSDSLIDGRLFDQAKRLSGRYDRPMILIEGDDIFHKRNINKNALYGALASITLNFNIPLMFTRDPKETAEFMMVVHKKEEQKNDKKRSDHRDRSITKDELGVRVISALPGVSIVIAKRIKERFKTIRSLSNATLEELMEVEGIGDKKAREIFNALNQE